MYSLLFLPITVPGFTRRAGTDTLARLRRQGGGEVNDGHDADDSDDERRWRSLMPMLMNPAALGAPAVSGILPTVQPNLSHFTPTPTLRDWCSRVLPPLYGRGNGDGHTITYPDKLSHEAHLQPPRRGEHMTLPLTFPCQEMLPGPVGLASCGHREACVLGDSVVTSCPLNQVHH